MWKKANYVMLCKPNKINYTVVMSYLAPSSLCPWDLVKQRDPWALNHPNCKFSKRKTKERYIGAAFEAALQ